jgi:hypothetical protein
MLVRLGRDNAGEGGQPSPRVVVNATRFSRWACTIDDGTINDAVVEQVDFRDRDDDSEIWHPGRVVATVNLLEDQPAYSQLLSTSGRRDGETSRRPLLLVLDVGAVDGPGSPAASPARTLAMGDALTVTGFPFPQLLGRKFLSTHRATVSCALPPSGMVLLDASVAMGGLEGAALRLDGEVVGMLGETVAHGASGARWVVGWDLSIIIDKCMRGHTARRVARPLHIPASRPVERTLSRLVSVHVDDTFASGFVIGRRGGDAIVCTNAHAVPTSMDPLSVLIRRVDGTMYGATCWASFEGILDLAFLLARIPVNNDDISAPLSPSPSPSPSITGRAVFAIGFPGTWNPKLDPLSPLSAPKLTAGTITSVLDDDRGPCCLTTDCRIVEGCSGSPIVDAGDGRLVGMASSNAVIISRVPGEPRTYHPELNFCVPGLLIQDTLLTCLAAGPEAARAALADRHIDRLMWGTPAKL